MNSILFELLKINYAYRVNEIPEEFKKYFDKSFCKDIERLRTSFSESKRIGDVQNYGDISVQVSIRVSE